MIRIRLPSGVWFGLGCFVGYLASSGGVSPAVNELISKYLWLLY